MILLDTNVVSELLRPHPDPSVAVWVAAQNAAASFISAITEAELRLGVALLPEGKRRTALGAILEDILSEDFRGRILPFDSSASSSFARIAAARAKMGRPISHPDAQIAATVLSRGARLATRNTADFEACGLELINPWAGGH
jgi:predicted nucleic acid-binding protein